MITEPTKLEADDDRGLRCNCGCRKLRVLYTRARPGGMLLRRRECKECRERITTWERVIGVRRVD
jgi:transcriptional regulator NrdR family protein